MEPSTLRWITLLSRKTLVYLSSALAPYGLTAAEEPFYMSLYYVEGITQEELTALVYADKASTARRLMPAWMVMKSTPSSAWARTTLRKSWGVISSRSLSR